MAQQVMTRSGYERLQSRLEYLEERHREVLDELQQLKREEGQDEGIMYDVETRRQDIESKIAELKSALSEAIIADSDEINTVTIGNRVTVRDEAEGDEFDFDLISAAEVTGGGSGISSDSPVGAALLNHKIGDTVAVSTPDGDVKYTILAIQPIPDAE